MARRSSPGHCELPGETRCQFGVLADVLERSGSSVNQESFVGRHLRILYQREEGVLRLAIGTGNQVSFGTHSKRRHVDFMTSTIIKQVKVSDVISGNLQIILQGCSYVTNTGRIGFRLVS